MIGFFRQSSLAAVFRGPDGYGVWCGRQRAVVGRRAQCGVALAPGRPGAQGDAPADKPTLTVCLPAPAQANGTAVVICPGGGYAHLASGPRGARIAQWLNSLGVAGFILEYRHRGKGYSHPAPLQDAQRAMRTVRARAAEWHVDPGRIGIMGFSAGGHLASTAGTHFDKGKPEAADPIERASCRPDFMILCYAVIMFGEPATQRLAEKPDRRRRRCGAGPQPFQRKTGDAGHPADLPFPHRRRYDRSGGQQRAVLPGPASRQGAGRAAHLPHRQARPRAGGQHARHLGLAQVLRRVAARAGTGEMTSRTLAR